MMIKINPKIYDLKNEVLETDRGIILMALEVYANFIASQNGSIKLQTKVLDLSTSFKNCKSFSLE